MKALVVKGSLSAEELSKIAKVEKDVRLNRRLQALSLIKRGWRIGDVSTAMLVSKRTIENWSKSLPTNLTRLPYTKLTGYNHFFLLDFLKNYGIIDYCNHSGV